MLTYDYIHLQILLSKIGLYVVTWLLIHVLVFLAEMLSVWKTILLIIVFILVILLAAHIVELLMFTSAKVIYFLETTKYFQLKDVKSFVFFDSQIKPIHYAQKRIGIFPRFEVTSHYIPCCVVNVIIITHNWNIFSSSTPSLSKNTF